MKLICIDGNEANVAHQVGVSVYTHHLLHEFKKHACDEIRFCIYLRRPPLFHMPRESKYFRYRIVWGPVGWCRFFLPLRLRIDYVFQRLRRLFDMKAAQFHAFFAPAHYAPPWLPPKCKLIVTVHDLAFLFYPKEFLKRDLYKLTEWTAESVYKADIVIAVSKHTRNDVLHQYKIEESKVITILSGYHYTKPSTPPLHNSKFFLIDGKRYPLKHREYVLYVGTLQPRKNIKTLLYAFALFHKEQPDQHLVIAGKKGWMYEEIFETSRKLRVDHVVHFTGYIPEHDKINLYTHALCTVLPSFYEGFGFPLLEAFAASCPVISSETSSLPEIGGSAPLYFRPDNAQDLLNKLRLVEKDYKLCNDMIERGHTRLRQFSWETCGEDTLEVLLQ